MAPTYTETPDNYSEIKESVVADIDEIKSVFFKAEKVLFYDACSFQRHSNLRENEKNILIQYFENRGIAIFLTRCILMELSGDNHVLNRQFIEYINKLKNSGVSVVIFDEEYTYSILSDCFSTIERVNEYLMWAVRMAKSPTSTITDTLKMNDKLNSEVVEGKNLKASDLYQRFFSAVRSNKEHEDNLGEELISICAHILSYLPGVPDGKLCVLTDDKGAASKIDSLMRRTNQEYRGSRIILFSTPKLIQHMFQEGVGLSEDEIVNLLSQGISENIVIMGITDYDFRVNDKIPISCRELAQKIIEPNGIKIVFKISDRYKELNNVLVAGTGQSAMIAPFFCTIISA